MGETVSAHRELMVRRGWASTGISNTRRTVFKPPGEITTKGDGNAEEEGNREYLRWA